MPVTAGLSGFSLVLGPWCSHHSLHIKTLIHTLSCDSLLTRDGVYSWQHWVTGWVNMGGQDMGPSTRWNQLSWLPPRHCTAEPRSGPWHSWGTAWGWGWGSGRSSLSRPSCKLNKAVPAHASANEDNDTLDPPVEEIELWSWPQIPTANGTSRIICIAVAQTFQAERKWRSWIHFKWKSAQMYRDHEPRKVTQFQITRRKNWFCQK